MVHRVQKCHNGGRGLNAARASMFMWIPSAKVCHGTCMGQILLQLEPRSETKELNTLYLSYSRVWCHGEIPANIIAKLWSHRFAQFLQTTTLQTYHSLSNMTLPEHTHLRTHTRTQHASPHTKPLTYPCSPSVIPVPVTSQDIVDDSLDDKHN